MSDSFSKKENAKKKAKKKQEKALKREDRKTNNNKDQSLENMFAYVDENGLLTTTPPDKRNKTDINLDSILLGARPLPVESIKTGVVTFFSEKGYGFITDDETKTNLFFHSSDLLQPVKLKDKVNYEIKRTPRGDNAINLKKI